MAERILAVIGMWVCSAVITAIAPDIIPEYQPDFGRILAIGLSLYIIWDPD